MKISIMQPYFFPYIGYFQLMSACDVFVVFDDVQYIRRGWVNRNRILVNGEPQWITMPVAAADYNLPINQRHYLLDDRLAIRLRRRIVGAYANAPQFGKVMPVIDSILSLDDANVARFNANLLSKLAEFLGIRTPIKLASEITKNMELAGQELVIDICKRLGTTAYVNPIGGLKLYQQERFEKNGFGLSFLESIAEPYKQFGEQYISGLSIIDVLMFNDMDTVKSMLVQYRLVKSRDGLTDTHIQVQHI